MFKTRQGGTPRFLAEPSLLGEADTFGIELLHPWREGRRDNRLGAKGLSNHRWIIGAKIVVVLNPVELVCGWDCNQANVSDTEFRPLIAQFADERVVLTDSAFHGRWGDPANMKACRCGQWNTRILLDADQSLSSQTCLPSRGRLLPRSDRFCPGRFQPTDPVGWTPSR